MRAINTGAFISIPASAEMTELLFEGPMDTKSELEPFGRAVQDIVDSLDYEHVRHDQCCLLFYELIHSPRSVPGRYEMKIPHLIKRNGKLISATLVVETKLCRLTWESIEPHVVKKSNETRTSRARITLQNITVVRNL